MLKKIKINLLSLAAVLMFSLALLPSVATAGPIAADSGSANPQSTATTPQTKAVSPQAAGTTSAQDQIQCGINEAAGGDCSAGAKSPSGDLASVIKKILNILSAISGVIAVVMIMVAGVRLVTSAGNEESVKKAKSTLVYAVVGLVLVALAQVIVHFVIHSAATS